jgi:hypothetical protein
MGWKGRCSGGGKNKIELRGVLTFGVDCVFFGALIFDGVIHTFIFATGSACAWGLQIIVISIASF